MKLDRRYHCFGCGADGDVIDFAAALYGLAKKEAAVQLANDFGLSYEDWKPPGKAKKPKPRQKSPEEQFQEAKNRCFRILADYLHLLMAWRKDYAPHSPEEAFHPRFVLETAKWGKFSVLGHLTLPLRYMNENHGMHMSFDGFEDEVAQVFRALIENGCGIECNVNRGNTPLPDAKWLRLYHELSGEIITIGTDAHTPEFVGMRARETQELLKSCGLDYVCTFEKKKPVFHKI